MDAKTLIDALVAVDSERPRSKQTAIGVSALGGCARKVWHTLQGDTGVSRGTRLPAIMGTAIHTAIEQAFAGTGALIEHRVEIDGFPPATIDYFNPATGEVVDWKTIKKSGADWFVNRQKRWQIQTYGYLMALAGYDVKTVTLVGIPRDGDENDIIIHSEPFDAEVALEAFAWLKAIETADQAPAPEMDAVSFCSKYCDFYGDLCRGKVKDVTGAAITDETAEKAAKRYREVSAQLKVLEAEKDAARAALEGVNGVTIDGITVNWSETKGRESVDMDAVKFLLPEVPMKTGAPSLRLTVK